MTANKLKTLALFGAVALGLAFIPGTAKAQTVNATLTTDAGITTVDVSDMGFGTWFLAYIGADSFTLDMDTAGTVVANGIATSFATELVPGSGFGEVTVDLPLGANNIVLQMTATAITDFADPALTLQSLLYETATELADQPFVPLVGTDVTVVTGGTPESVRFGATIAVSAQPADGLDTATFDVSFAF
ncbi:MAG: hypothetical protein ACXW4B_10460 [Micavibrio sp.]